MYTLLFLPTTHAHSRHKNPETKVSPDIHIGIIPNMDQKLSTDLQH